MINQGGIIFPKFFCFYRKKKEERKKGLGTFDFKLLKKGGNPVDYPFFTF
jgi:hypothetical protein